MANEGRDAKYKIMGNMIWFMESSEPPRQVTAIERELLSDLARVRGLLQRQWISVEERLPSEGIDVSITVLSSCESYVWAGYYIPAHVGMPGEWFFSNHQGVKGRVTHWQPFPDLPNFPQSSDLVPQGAESVEMGKVNSVDEKWKRGIPPSEIWTCNGCGEEYRIGAKCDLCPTELKSGVEILTADQQEARSESNNALTLTTLVATAAYSVLDIIAKNVLPLPLNFYRLSLDKEN